MPSLRFCVLRAVVVDLLTQHVDLTVYARQCDGNIVEGFVGFLLALLQMLDLRGVLIELRLVQIEQAECMHSPAADTGDNRQDDRGLIRNNFAEVEAHTFISSFAVSAIAKLYTDVLPMIVTCHPSLLMPAGMR
jgi:hypothetical protein